MASEIQTVCLSYERVAVGSRMARVLEVILAEVLVRLHIEGLGIHVHDEIDCIIMKLTACMSCEELMSLRNVHVTYERILKFTDDGARLVVGNSGSEAYRAVLKGYSECDVHLEGLATVHEVGVCNGDHITLLRHCRGVFSAVDLHLLLFMSVVEDSPQTCACSVVMAGLIVSEHKKGSVFSYLDFDVVIAQYESRNVASAFLNFSVIGIVAAQNQC